MRILRPIVQALMLAMLNVKLHFPARRGVGLEFVGDHDAWRLNGAFQEFRRNYPLPFFRAQILRNYPQF
jgi:hypothetical protein